jgi:hypothetical protein
MRAPKLWDGRKFLELLDSQSLSVLFINETGHPRIQTERF